MANELWVFSEKSGFLAELIAGGRMLAEKMQGSVTALVLGAREEAEKAVSMGADKVLWLGEPDPAGMVEDYVPTIANLVEDQKPKLLLIGATKRGKAVAGRLGGRLGCTTICATAMRELPYGIPKMIVSTLASGNTRWHIDISDIILIPSLLDIGGLNPMIQMVLNNAAYAIAGMVKGHRPYHSSGKKVVSVTMYGTTTPGVSRAREVVEEAGYEVWVFHASGVGGRTMEKLMSMGRIQGVMDMTLAEIGAHLVGGLHDAGPHRMEEASGLGIPQVIVPGAADTIVLPPRDQVPEKFKNRRLNFHNPTMTTMRTTAEENTQIATFIAEKLNRAKGPVCVIFPLGGLSSIDRPGKIFYDPEANRALFSTLKQKLNPKIEIIEDEHHLDDPEFAVRVGESMIRLMKQKHP